MLYYIFRKAGGMAEWLKAAVLKTVELNGSVGSNPTPSATDPVAIRKAGAGIPVFDPAANQGILKNTDHGEMAESAEGARLLSE